LSAGFIERRLNEERSAVESLAHPAPTHHTDRHSQPV
jgi:hypothetical protein